jgi:hypothetical protein
MKAFRDTFLTLAKFFNSGFLFLIFLFQGVPNSALSVNAIFIPTQEALIPYYNTDQAVMVASTGRSGSSILCQSLYSCAPHDYLLLKTHILPPKKHFLGKIIFIFSNPDKFAESVLYLTLTDPQWIRLAFYHIESSDKEWLKKIGTTPEQTETENLLAYDALGYFEQLKCWFYDRTTPCELNEAQILAVKYEHLWEPATQQVIEDFLLFENLSLPPQRERGRKWEVLTEKERSFRTLYNTGTQQDPRYAAYDEARLLWESAPPFQFLYINDESEKS